MNLMYVDVPRLLPTFNATVARVHVDAEFAVFAELAVVAEFAVPARVA